MTNYSDIVSRKTGMLGLKYLDFQDIKLPAKKTFRKRSSTSYGSHDIFNIG